jgi:hypothetical protein
MSGITDLFGGGSSGSASTLDDAALGDAITGGSSLFGSTGGSDLGSMFSSIGQAFAGGGANPASTPAGTVDAITQATDPTGSIGAQTAITGGQGGANAPQPTQNQNPQGPQGGGQGGGDQFAPPSAVDALKKALTGLRQQQRQNPYAFPGGPGNAEAGQNSPMLNRASRIPTDQVSGADDPDAPSQYASAMEADNDNQPPPPSNAIDPADAVRAGLRSNAPDTSGQFQIPGPANENNPPQGGLPATQPGVPAVQGGGGGLVPGGGGAIVPQTPDGSDGLGGLASLARMLGIGPMAASAVPLVASTTPTAAATGVETTRTLGRSPSGPSEPTLDPSDPFSGSAFGPAGSQPAGTIPPAGTDTYTPRTPITSAPATGKKVETVDPKTKKPVNPKTGDPLPTKKGPLPTKTDEIPTGQDQPGSIQRDIHGVSHGVPPALGQLAQMAMPLLMMAMGGMGGGRGRHGGRGFGGMGHPGGRGMWPYHHPSFGWGMHGFHPGGGWRPMHPVHFRDMGGGGPMSYAGGGQGGTGNPQLDALLQGLGGQQGGGNQGQSGFGRPQGGGLNWSQPQTQGPWSANPFLNTIVGAESSGRNSGAPGQGPGGDGGIARGYYNIQTPTWGEFAKGVPGAAQYTTADQAPPEIQTQVAMTIPAARFGDRTRAILHRQFGNFDERMTLGQLADQFGGKDWAANKPTPPGAIATGGSKAPNPDGNPAPAITQQDPEAVAAAS